MDLIKKEKMREEDKLTTTISLKVTDGFKGKLKHLKTLGYDVPKILREAVVDQVEKALEAMPAAPDVETDGDRVLDNQDISTFG